MRDEVFERTPPDSPELLVPFDGSRGAEKVLRQACRTARRDGVSLVEHELGETALMSETVQAVLAAAPCSVLLEDPSRLPPSPRVECPC